MELSFNKSDSFYKIFKTFEKLPDNKKLLIYINPENQFYNNKWRGEQLIQLLENKNATFEFVSNNNQTKEYFETLGAKIYKPNEVFDYNKIFQVIYMFFFKIKDFHIYIINKKNVSRYLIIGIEILVMIGVVYGLYAVTIPTADIYIYPSYNSEEILYNFRYYNSDNTGYVDNKQISIPYYDASIDYEYNMNTTVKNIRYLQNPSRGQIKIYNTTDSALGLKPNTKLITDDGMIYKTLNRLNLKPGSSAKPSETIIDVEALETDIKGNIIGQRGNIPSGTKLLIKNLRTSFITKQVYSEAFSDFTGGKTNTKGTITNQDILSFSGKISDFIGDNKKEILIKQLNNSDIKPMLFDDTIDVIPVSLETSQKVGSDSSTIEGTMKFKITYKYINRIDMQNAVNKYIKQRPSDSISLIDIDKTSTTFFEKNEIGSGVYIIPTKVNTVRGYNFESDISNIKNNIIEKIIGKDTKSARDSILSYPDVSDVNIKLSPFWIKNIPNFKSNIKIYNGKKQ